MKRSFKRRAKRRAIIPSLKNNQLIEVIQHSLFLATLLLEFGVIYSQTCKDVSHEEIGFALIGTEYRTITTSEYAWCVAECIEDSDCMSTNYDSKTQKCELNSQTKETLPDLFKKMTHGTYTENLNKRIPKPLLGSKERPVKSCLNILSSNHSKGTGVYWLDPPSTGNPIQAYCDMDTDGGGWTTVLRLLVRRLPVPPYGNYKLYNSYDVIGAFNSTHYVIPTTSGLADIQNKMGFQQIHFYCHKKNGSVFSIMTKKNTAGQQVLRFFTDDTFASSTFPDACGSFDRLPEDTSILSQNCDKWGKDSSGNVQVGKWGKNPFIGPWRLRLAIFMNGSGIFNYDTSNFHCDDSVSSPSLLDTWRISVR